MYPQKKVKDGNVDEKTGIVHIINGTGGANWQEPAAHTPKTAFTPNAESFATITFLIIQRSKAQLQTIDARQGHNLQVINEYNTSINISSSVGMSI